MDPNFSSVSVTNCNLPEPQTSAQKRKSCEMNQVTYKTIFNIPLRSVERDSLFKHFFDVDFSRRSLIRSTTIRKIGDGDFRINNATRPTDNLAVELGIANINQSFLPFRRCSINKASRASTLEQSPQDPYCAFNVFHAYFGLFGHARIEMSLETPNTNTLLGVGERWYLVAEVHYDNLSARATSEERLFELMKEKINMEKFSLLQWDMSFSGDHCLQSIADIPHNLPILKHFLLHGRRDMMMFNNTIIKFRASPDIKIYKIDDTCDCAYGQSVHSQKDSFFTNSQFYNVPFDVLRYENKILILDILPLHMLGCEFPLTKDSALAAMAPYNDCVELPHYRWCLDNIIGQFIVFIQFFRPKLQPLNKTGAYDAAVRKQAMDIAASEAKSMVEARENTMTNL